MSPTLVYDCFLNTSQKHQPRQNTATQTPPQTATTPKKHYHQNTEARTPQDSTNTTSTNTAPEGHFPSKVGTQNPSTAQKQYQHRQKQPGKCIITCVAPWKEEASQHQSLWLYYAQAIQVLWLRNLGMSSIPINQKLEPCFFLCGGYILAWRLRRRLRRATVCVNVAKHLREESRKDLFHLIHGAAEVDEEELDEPVLDEEGWARRLCVWHANRKGSFWTTTTDRRMGKDLWDGCVGYANAYAEATQRLRWDEN